MSLNVLQDSPSSVRARIDFREGKQISNQQQNSNNNNKMGGGGVSLAWLTSHTGPITGDTT